MKRDFKKGGFKPRGTFGGSRSERPSFGGSRQWDSKPARPYGRSAERPVFFAAVCSTCGQSCEVPFKPSPDKAVFCRNCFVNDKDQGKSGRFDRHEGRRPSNTSAFDPRVAELVKQVESLARKVEKLFSLVSPVSVAHEDYSDSDFHARASFTPKKFAKKGSKKVNKRKK